MTADQFAQIPNRLIRDAALSPKARLLWIWLASHRAGWHTSIQRLADANGIGVDAARTGIQELIEAGWIRRSADQNHPDTGRFTGYRYTLCEPSLDLPCMDLPCTDKPCTDKPTPKNTNTPRTPKQEQASPPPTVISPARATSQLTFALDPDGENAPPPPEQKPETPRHPGGVATDPDGYRFAKRVLPDQPERVLAKLGLRIHALRDENKPDDLIEDALHVWASQDRYGPAGLDYVVSDVIRARAPRVRAPKESTIAQYAAIKRDPRFNNPKGIQ